MPVFFLLVIKIPIQIYCHASCGNKLGLWAYEVQYHEEDGNKLHDIWNSDDKTEDNTTQVKMQFAAILEAFLYLNGLTEPDTKDVLLHVPSKDIVKWLTKEYSTENYPTNRSKVARLYRHYCFEIWAEMKGWNVKYKVIDEALPEWLLLKLGWSEDE